MHIEQYINYCKLIQFYLIVFIIIEISVLIADFLLSDRLSSGFREKTRGRDRSRSGVLFGAQLSLS